MHAKKNSNKTHTHIISSSSSFSLDAIANLHHHLLLLVAATDGDNNTTMDPTNTNLIIPTPQSSSLSYQPSPNNNTNFSPSNNSHILEISLISAQDLAPVSKSLRTYALTWINPNRKRSTKVDNKGHNNPMWNDKFSFKVNEEFLYSENSAVHVEIYTVSWFRDVLVGTINVQLNNLINPYVNFQNSSNGKRCVALQIRRPSGNPQGILNMEVAIIENSMRSMPLLCNNEIMGLSSLDYRDILDKKMSENHQEVDVDKKREINEKVQLWRSLSLGYSEVDNDEFLTKGGSICNGSMANGSMVNGSELCSDVGPSASIVAAEIAAKRYQQPPSSAQSEPRQEVETKQSKEMEDGECSIIVGDLTAEQAYAKGLLSSSRERLIKEKAATTQTRAVNGEHARRNSDGGGLFSCFGNAYGIEFRIVCGANNNNNNNNNVGINSSRIPNTINKGRKKWSSETNSA